MAALTDTIHTWSDQDWSGARACPVCQQKRRRLLEDIAMARTLHMPTDIRTRRANAGGIDQAEKDVARHDSDLHLPRRQCDPAHEDW